jgi:hypothetical protein
MKHPLLEINSIHPKDFRYLNKLSLSEMHRLTGYPVETIKNWLAPEDSTKYSEPKEYVKRYLGLLHQALASSSRSA